MRKTIALAFLLCGCAAQPWTKLPEETFEVSVEPMVELDSLDKNALGKMRDDAIRRENRLKALVPDKYEGSQRQIYAGVRDGALWNGADGMFQGNSSTRISRLEEGPSLDSVFVQNPFVLAGILPHFGYFSGRESFQQKWTDSQTPTKVTYDGKARTIRVQYIHHVPQLEYLDANGAVYNLNLTNAADLGLASFAVVPKDTKGFVGISGLAGHTFEFGKVYPLSQHYGSDAIPGREGKLANLFYDSEVVVLERLPATLKIAFWRDPQAKFQDFPDFFEELQVTCDESRFQGMDLKRLRGR